MSISLTRKGDDYNLHLSADLITITLSCRNMKELKCNSKGEDALPHRCRNPFQLHFYFWHARVIGKRLIQAMAINYNAAYCIFPLYYVSKSAQNFWNAFFTETSSRTIISVPRMQANFICHSFTSLLNCYLEFLFNLFSLRILSFC